MTKRNIPYYILASEFCQIGEIIVCEKRTNYVIMFAVFYLKGDYDGRN